MCKRSEKPRRLAGSRFTLKVKGLRALIPPRCRTLIETEILLVFIVNERNPLLIRLNDIEFSTTLWILMEITYRDISLQFAFIGRVEKHVRRIFLIIIFLQEIFSAGI